MQMNIFVSTMSLAIHCQTIKSERTEKIYFIKSIQCKYTLLNVILLGKHSQLFVMFLVFFILSLDILMH